MHFADCCTQPIQKHQFLLPPTLIHLPQNFLLFPFSCLHLVYSQCKFFQNNLSLFSPNSLHKRALAAPGWGTLMQIPAHGIHVLWLRRDKFTQTTKSCGEKGTAWPLPQEESISTLAVTGFYCFSGHITLRMILFTMHRFPLGGYRKQRRGGC